MTENDQGSRRGVSRRQLLIGGASAGGALAAGGMIAGMAGAASSTPTAPAYHLQVLSAEEADLYGAMADRIFPPDAESPGAKDLGFVAFFDGQLNSPWGSGDGLYTHGPVHEATTSGLGYQLTMPFKDLYKLVATRIIAYVQQHYNGSFSSLSADQQDAILTDMEAGKVDLGLSSNVNGYTSAYFFSLFLGFVEQALFSDPMYGGNVGMAGWKWVGFPGDPMGYGDAYWTIFPHQDDAYNVPPHSIEEDVMGGFAGIDTSGMSGMEMDN